MNEGQVRVDYINAYEIVVWYLIYKINKINFYNGRRN
jgi:hypothetical protein